MIVSKSKHILWTYPSGMPASLTNWAIKPSVHGTFSEGLTMTVFPVANAIGIVQKGTYNQSASLLSVQGVPSQEN